MVTPLAHPATSPRRALTRHHPARTWSSCAATRPGRDAGLRRGRWRSARSRRSLHPGLDRHAIRAPEPGRRSGRARRRRSAGERDQGPAPEPLTYVFVGDLVEAAGRRFAVDAIDRYPRARRQGRLDPDRGRRSRRSGADLPRRRRVRRAGDPSAGTRNRGGGRGPTLPSTGERVRTGPGPGRPCSSLTAAACDLAQRDGAACAVRADAGRGERSWVIGDCAPHPHPRRGAGRRLDLAATWRSARALAADNIAAGPGSTRLGLRQPEALLHLACDMVWTRSTAWNPRLCWMARTYHTGQIPGLARRSAWSSIWMLGLPFRRDTA